MLAMLKMSQSSVRIIRNVCKVNTATAAETTTTNMTANCQPKCNKSHTHTQLFFRLKVSMKIRIDETRPQEKNANNVIPK